MSFSIDAYGMNTVAEVKALTTFASPPRFSLIPCSASLAKWLSALIRFRQLMPYILLH